MRPDKKPARDRAPGADRPLTTVRRSFCPQVAPFSEGRVSGLAVLTVRRIWILTSSNLFERAICVRTANAGHRKASARARHARLASFVRRHHACRGARFQSIGAALALAGSPIARDALAAEASLDLAVAPNAPLAIADCPAVGNASRPTFPGVMVARLTVRPKGLTVRPKALTVRPRSSTSFQGWKFKKLRP